MGKWWEYVTNTDTVSALRDERENNNTAKIAVLNFASFKNAVGRFMEGLMAQEESLCHESFLYNVLREFEKTYYKVNRKGMNYGLYSNKALYSPDILFYDDGKEIVSADVITCAAPNKSAACRYHKISASENSEALKSRIKYIKSIAEEQKVEIIILGAFGAGVFGQNPAEVAELMRDTFSKTSITRVVYAVPGKDKNARVFEEYFSEI